MTRAFPIFFLLLACGASRQAQASWVMDCLLEGRVASAPSHEYSAPQRTHFTVFTFHVTNAEALEATYDDADCNSKSGNDLRAEVVREPGNPSFKAGDSVTLRYHYHEAQCEGGGACAGDWYEFVTPRQAKRLRQSNGSPQRE